MYNNENKVHYKMYKAGTKWIVAGLTTIAFIGGSTYLTSAHADKTNAPVANSTTVQMNTTESDNNQVKSDAVTSSNEKVDNNQAVAMDNKSLSNANTVDENNVTQDSAKADTTAQEADNNTDDLIKTSNDIHPNNETSNNLDTETTIISKNDNQNSNSFITNTQQINTAITQNSDPLSVENGTWGSAQYKFNEDDETLSFDNGGDLGNTTLQDSWLQDNYKSVKHVEFNSKVRVDDTNGLFARWGGVVDYKGLQNLDTSGCSNFDNMFLDNHSLESIDLTGLNTSNSISMNGFLSTNRGTDGITGSALTSVNLGGIGTAKVENFSSLFNGDESLTTIQGLNQLDTSSATNMDSMFKNNYVLNQLDLSNFNTANVTKMGNMFRSLYSVQSLDVSSFNTTNVVDMSYMFCGVANATKIIGLASFDTENVTDMSYMFNGDASLIEIKGLESFNTVNVTDMSNMFNDDQLLTTTVYNADYTNGYLDNSRFNISHFNTGNVTNMSNMFSNDYNIMELDLSNFNTINVTDMSNMFNGDVNLASLNLSSFDTVNANISNMLSNLLIYQDGYLYGLGQLILGINTILNSKIGLFTPPENSSIPITNDMKTTGYWQNIGTGNYPSIPMGGDDYTPNGILINATGKNSLTDGKSHAGTWVWSIVSLISEVSEEGTGTETIHYVDVNGKKIASDEVITSHFTRNGTKDNMTSDITWNGDWTSTDDIYNITSPIIANMTPDKNKVQGTVNEGENNEATVTYTDNTSEVTDSTSNTITIHYVDTEGKTVTPDKVVTAHFVRTGTKDDVTGDITWNGWTSTDDTYDIKSPTITNMTPDQTSVQVTITEGKNDEEIVTYTDNTSEVTDSTSNTITIHYVDTEGKTVTPDKVVTAHFVRTGTKDDVTGDITWNGWTSTDDTYDIKSPVIINMIPNPAEVHGTITEGENDEVTITYTDNTSEVTDSTSNTITIHYVDTEGKAVTPDKVVTDHFTRTGTKDDVTGNTVWDGWTSTDDTYDITSQSIANMTPDKTKVQGTITEGKNNEVTVTYTDNTSEVTDSISGTETIHYVDADGKTVAPDKVVTAHFTRTGIKDDLTGDITWNGWTSTDDTYDIKSPVITNMTTNQTEVHGTIIEGKNDETTVIYNLNLNDDGKAQIFVVPEIHLSVNNQWTPSSTILDLIDKNGEIVNIQNAIDDGSLVSSIVQLSKSATPTNNLYRRFFMLATTSNVNTPATVQEVNTVPGTYVCYYWFDGQIAQTTIYVGNANNDGQIIDSIIFVDSNNDKVGNGFVLKGDQGTKFDISTYIPNGYTLANPSDQWFTLEKTGAFTILVAKDQVPNNPDNGDTNNSGSTTTPTKPSDNNNGSNDSGTVTPSTPDNGNSNSSGSTTTPTKPSNNDQGSNDGGTVTPSKTDNGNANNSGSTTIPTKPSDNNTGSNDGGSVTPSKPDNGNTTSSGGATTPTKPSNDNQGSNGDGTVAPSKPDNGESNNSGGATTPTKPSNDNQGSNGDGTVAPNKPDNGDTTNSGSTTTPTKPSDNNTGSNSDESVTTSNSDTGKSNNSGNATTSSKPDNGNTNSSESTTAPTKPSDNNTGSNVGGIVIPSKPDNGDTTNSGNSTTQSKLSDNNTNSNNSSVIIGKSNDYEIIPVPAINKHSNSIKLDKNDDSIIKINANKKHSLPATGENSDNKLISLVGMILVTFSGLFGLTKKWRKLTK
ncbi:mucin-binding protein [Fructilactobacillus sp. Tb1]|uniref:mucin-binding protein n=1 Tax=Fructilactobacillus sp. Tb1 TaxID=3422304 RepID=UPI003D2CB47B